MEVSSYKLVQMLMTIEFRAQENIDSGWDFSVNRKLMINLFLSLTCMSSLVRKSLYFFEQNLWKLSCLALDMVIQVIFV